MNVLYPFDKYFYLVFPERYSQFTVDLMLQLMGAFRRLTVHRHIESSFINLGHLIEDQADSHWHTVASFSILCIVSSSNIFSLPAIQFSHPALSLLSEEKGS